MEFADFNIIDNFKKRAADWAAKVVALHDTKVPKELQGEKDKLLKMAGTIKKTIEGIFGTFDELQNVGVGVLPLIPVAVAVTAIAAITKWTFDYMSLVKKIETHSNLIAHGVSPESASNIVKKITDSPTIDLNMGSVAGSLAVIALGWFIMNEKKGT